MRVGSAVGLDQPVRAEIAVVRTVAKVSAVGEVGRAAAQGNGLVGDLGHVEIQEQAFVAPPGGVGR